MMQRLVVVGAVAAVLLATSGAGDAAPRHRARPTIDVSGSYSSNFDEVTLTQHGSQIDGEYVCCGGGTIEGTIDGRVIHYHWEQADGTEGSGVWKAIGSQKLEGTWGTGDSEDDGGVWNLERVDE